jgi:hypothetical protein
MSTWHTLICFYAPPESGRGGGSLGLIKPGGIGEHVVAKVDAGRRHLGEEPVHLRRRGVVVGVVVGAVVVPMGRPTPLRSRPPPQPLSVGVELGVEGARRQRDDASELGEALVLGGHELARALGRRRVLSLSL